MADNEDTGGEYTPVVKLGIIATSDGEEHENVIYRQKSILLRFDADTKEWKERGRGDVRLLQNKENKKIRIILRQTKTLKIRMNHFVQPGTELKANPGSDRAWTWVATDFSDEVAKVESFAIRFKDSETANAFKTIYDQARKANGGDKDITFTALADAAPEPEEAPKKEETDEKPAESAAAGATATATA